MRGPESSRSVTTGMVDRLWVLVVAGIPTGVLIGGVASRAAMLLLRLTSSDHVRGAVSDDGFVIGRFTLGGTYNLLVLGAVVGVIGAALYTWVAPWLLGPSWFRRLTIALGCGAVVGSMLIHSDGVDFTLLEPRWLAVGLFVALPALFGWTIGVAVDRARAAVDKGRTRRQSIVAVVLAACFPPVLFVMVPIIVVLAAWSALRHTVEVEPVQRALPVAIGVRILWLVVATLGLVELAGDVAEIV